MVTIGWPALAQEGQSPFAPESATPSAATPAVLDEWIVASIRPDLQQTIREMMPTDLPVYMIDVTLEPQGGLGSVPSLSGHLSVEWDQPDRRTVGGATVSVVCEWFGRWN